MYMKTQLFQFQHTKHTSCYWCPGRTTEAMKYMVKPGREFSCLRGMGIGMTPASFFTISCAFVFVLLMCSTAVGSEGQNTTCVSSYYQFEEVAITNNSKNIDALFSTLYKPNNPLPYSVTVLYQVQLPNGTTQRISSDPNCPSELWMWTYSPVFLLAEPSLFNRFTLYTINYFKVWHSPTVTITVPCPCNSSISEFLNRMTMSVNEYAQARVKHIKQLGYVLKGCGRKAEETPMRADMDSKNRNKIQIIFTNLLLGGLLFQTMLICLGGALLLQHWMPAISGHSLYCSKTYSMLWAVMTTATVFWAAAIAADTYSAVAIYKYKKFTAAICALLVSYPALLELPVAVYFARKYSFAIPCVYLVPVKLLCCRHKSRAALLVRVISLWIFLSAIQLACVHGVVTVVATAAAPFPVISNVLVIIFTMFSLVHLFAITYNLSRVLRPKSNQTAGMGLGMGLGSTVLHGISFVLLLVTLICFALVGAGLGFIINISSGQGTLFNLDKVIVPVILCVTGFALRRLSNLWWSTYVTRPTDGNEIVWGLGVSRNEYTAI